MTTDSWLYVFLDEGGNFDFSSTGTRYFTLSSVTMRQPFTVRGPWDDYKHDCLQYGLDIDHFHCADDNNHIRNQLFGIIGRHLEGMSIDSLVIEKAKTEPSSRTDNRFYPEMLGYLLRNVFKHARSYQKLIVITDVIPHQKKRRAIEKGIKQILNQMLPSGVKYRLLHHPSRSHYGLQIADYCNWAIYRKWCTNESRFYDVIETAICSELDIFENKTRYYY